MSVRDRVARLERGGTVRHDEESPPRLPTRPATTAYSSESVAPAHQTSVKQRPVVPRKAKSLSGNAVTIQQPSSAKQSISGNVADHNEVAERLVLIHLDPSPESDDEATTELSASAADISVEHEEGDRPALPLQRSASPLKAVTDGFSKIRIKPPAVIRAVSDSAQQLAREAQGISNTAFLSVANGTQTIFSSVQREAPKAFQTAAKGTQNAFVQVGEGIKRTVNGIPVPAEFAETREDLSDLSSLYLDKPGLCSRCRTLDLSACFDASSNGGEAYLNWTMPLARAALHYKWCHLCKLLIEMLSRPEYDPLKSYDVRQSIRQDKLRDLPFAEWVAKGYLHQTEYWPFGHSNIRYEGSTQVVGPASETLWDVTKRGASLGSEVLRLSADQKRSAAERRRLDHVRRLEKEVDRLKQEKKPKLPGRYPISAIISLTISGAAADKPGLLLVELIGYGHTAAGNQEVLSRFMLHAVRNRFTASQRPGKALTYGHVLDPHWVDAGMAKLWLTDCEGQHGELCNEHGWSLAMPKVTFLRVIDVEDMHIRAVDQPQTARFVALSYVWGYVDMLKLRSSNMHQLAQHGGLRQHLHLIPRTILDAMQVVRAAGERYLWVDALCILQEDTVEAHEQIADMDRIYGQALFTIVAAHAPHADAGLPGVLGDFPTASKESTPRHIVQSTAVISDSTTIIAPLDTRKHQDVYGGVWNLRAWTFQERILSRRLLFFTDNEMIWHCRRMIAREDMPEQKSGDEVEPLHWWDLKPQHFGVGEQNWSDGSFERTRHGRTLFVRSHTFAEYAGTIALYTRREMSYEKDAVNALAGLLRIFSMAFRSECIYGLPSVFLDASLLWQPVSSVQRRDTTLGFPSWSWCGWNGSIAYSKPIEIRRDAIGGMSKIEGVQPLLRYFVFDGSSGALRPLNGTARGLPRSENELPAEWEAHGPKDACWDSVHTCATPDLFDLDTLTIPHLSSRHLIFWTSTCSFFRVTAIDSPFSSVPGKAGIVDLDGSPAGVARFDDITLHDDEVPHTMTEMIVMAEAHCSALAPGSTEDDFGCYLLMLVKTDPSTKITSRLGLGWMSKPVWIANDPELQLICLG